MRSGCESAVQGSESAESIPGTVVLSSVMYASENKLYLVLYANGGVGRVSTIISLALAL